MARPSGGGLLRRPAPGEVTRKVGLFQFFGEVVSELKKVTWPSRAETVRLTLFVIALSVFIGIGLGVLDVLFTKLFEGLVSNP